jgi:hypothetical protein
LRGTFRVQEPLSIRQGFARTLFADSEDPPPLLRSYGAASFACHKLAWFTEPKLAEGERRMVDQNSVSWNQIAGWLRQLDHIRAAA